MMTNKWVVLYDRPDGERWAVGPMPFFRLAKLVCFANVYLGADRASVHKVLP